VLPLDRPSASGASRTAQPAAAAAARCRTTRAGRRLPDLAPVAREVAAWEARRNRERPTVRWHFTMVQARRKLEHLCPHPA
jgi:hypothetical protein